MRLGKAGPMLGLVALLAASSTAFSQTVTLQFIAPDAAASLLKSELFASVSERLEKAGRQYAVTWKVIAPEKGNTPENAVTFLKKSKADGALLSLRANSKLLPLHQVALTRPLTGVTSPEQLTILKSLSSQMPEMRQEFFKLDLVPLAMVMSGRQFIVLKPAIKGVLGFKGKRIAAQNYYAKILVGLGASAVATKKIELVDALKGGTIDGAVVAPASKKFASLINAKPAALSVVVDIGLAAMPVYVIVIKKNRWDGLPAPVRGAIRSGFSEFEQRLAQTILRSERQAAGKLPTNKSINLREPVAVLLRKPAAKKKPPSAKKKLFDDIALKKYDAMINEHLKSRPK